MRRVALGGKRGAGLFALIDDEDFVLVAGKQWSLDSEGYPQSRHEGRVVRLHRLLLAVPPGHQVDHRNGNRLDNRRANLRPATRFENARNGSTRRAGAKGVGTYRGRWNACITVDRRRIWLGTFDSEALAARAYDAAARVYHGEFARLNEDSPS